MKIGIDCQILIKFRSILYCGTSLDWTSSLGGSSDFIKYVVYVLVRKIKKVSYVGFINNIERRLEERDLGKNYFSKRYTPWEIKYT